VNRYLVKVEGTATQILASGLPAWSFSVTRAVKAPTEAEAKVTAIALVAREWNANGGRRAGARPVFRVSGLQPASWFQAWWKGRGGYVFHSSL
jgi:hypothetical protein